MAERLPSRMEHLSITPGFGPFKADLANHLDRGTALKLATLWDYPISILDQIQTRPQDIGLMMVCEMERRGQIKASDISPLLAALKHQNLDGIADRVEQSFIENTSANGTERKKSNDAFRRFEGSDALKTGAGPDQSQITRLNEQHADKLESLLRSIEETETRLQEPIRGAENIPAVNRLLEKQKTFDRELRQQKTASLDAIDATEKFLRDHHDQLPSHLNHKTRERIRELRIKFDHLTELSSQRQSDLKDLLIKLQREAHTQTPVSSKRPIHDAEARRPQGSVMEAVKMFSNLEQTGTRVVFPSPPKSKTEGSVVADPVSNKAKHKASEKGSDVNISNTPVDEILKPIDLSHVIINATDSEAEQRSTIQQLKNASDQGILVSNLRLDKSFCRIDTASGNIVLQSGLSLPYLSSVEQIIIWTTEGRIIGDDDFLGLLRFANQSKRLNLLLFQHCELPSSVPAGDAFSRIRSQGAKVTWVDTGHQLDLVTGKWKVDDMVAIRTSCGAGVVIYKQWSKNTQQLLINLLETASRNSVPITCVRLDYCYSSVSTDGANIFLQSGLPLPALSSVKLINISLEDGRKVQEDELVRLLKYAEYSKICNRLSFQWCEMPPTIPATTISTHLKSKDMKVSWLDSGHHFNLQSCQWELDDMDTIRGICRDGVLIYKHCSSHMHNLQVRFLLVASQNGIPINFTSLMDSFDKVDATSGNITLTSGVYLPHLSSLQDLAITAYGRELATDEVVGLVIYSKRISELDFYWCFLPPAITTVRISSWSTAINLKVLWYPEGPNEHGYTLNLSSGTWRNTTTMMDLTERDYQEMLVRFQVKWKTP